MAHNPGATRRHVNYGGFITMQCSRCGAPVQQGMAFCPNCGTPYTPVQMAPGAAPIPPTQYEPTVAAPPPYEPTVAAPPPYAGQSYQQPVSPTPSQPGFNDFN